MGAWLHSLRLFSLAMNGYTLDEGRALAERSWDGLAAIGLTLGDHDSDDEQHA